MKTDDLISIAHLTVCRDLPAGIRKQIRYEQDASKELCGGTWTSLAVHTGQLVEPFERSIPFPFRPILLRSLYGWIVVWRLSRDFDFVLVRHMPFDPFALLFAPFVRNRVSVHHSKEVEELPLIRPGFSGRLAAAVERVTGRVAVSRSLAVLGVTSEIARYECDTRSPGKTHHVYANGVDLRKVKLAEDQRNPEAVNVIFICNTFSAWHGLDRLLEAIADTPRLPEGLVIHLVGELSPRQIEQIAELGDRQSGIRVHGFLEAEAYRDVLAISDVGLGSLAMDRQNLLEGATLKVRELLAMGIAVYSGHRDTALPSSFPFYRNDYSVDIERLHAFATRLKKISRSEVREKSKPYIEKRAAMQSVTNWLIANLGTVRNR